MDRGWLFEQLQEDYVFDGSCPKCGGHKFEVQREQPDLVILTCEPGEEIKPTDLSELRIEIFMCWHCGYVFPRTDEMECAQRTYTVSREVVTVQTAQVVAPNRAAATNEFLELEDDAREIGEPVYGEPRVYLEEDEE